MKWGPVASSAPPGGEKPLWKLLCDQTLGSPEPGALQPAGVVVPCPLPQRGSELASPQEVPSPAPAPRPAAQAHGPPELELRGELLLGPHPLQARAAEPKSRLAWGKAGVCAQLLAHRAAERPPPEVQLARVQKTRSSSRAVGGAPRTRALGSAGGEAVLQRPLPSLLPGRAGSATWPRAVPTSACRRCFPEPLVVPGIL